MIENRDDTTAAAPCELSVSRIIVIGGSPAAGKTTFAHALRDALAWPLFAKDDFKELLFDSLGWSDRAHSKQMSATAYALMFAAATQLVRSKQSCILEGNFRWHEQQARFGALADAGVRVLQVFVTADPDVLAARFEARSARRHPGHVDAVSAAEVIRELREAPAQPLPLPLDCELIELRTDTLDAAAMASSVDRIRRWANGG